MVLQVVDICVGRSVPEVNNFRSLPTPSGAIWPQFLLDISYRGVYVVTECLFEVAQQLQHMLARAPGPSSNQASLQVMRG